MTKIEEALKIISNDSQQIAQDAYQTIISNNLQVVYFSKLQPKHYDRFKREMKNFFRIEVGPQPFSKTMLNLINTNVDGYQLDEYIYISSCLSIKNMIMTIIHEVDHYLNQSDKVDYNNPQIALEHELSAKMAEMEYLGKRITRGDIKRIKDEINYGYNLI